MFLIRLFSLLPTRIMARGVLVTGVIAITIMATPASAHFLELIPSHSLITKSKQSTLSFDIRFTHPMEGAPLMDMSVPRSFGVQIAGIKHDLTSKLVPIKLKGKLNPADVTSFKAVHNIKRAGDYSYYLSPIGRQKNRR